MTSEVLTSQDPGNTISGSPVIRARAFLFTINQVETYEAFEECFKKLKSCDYYVSAREFAPTTGHEHIHVYAHFESNYKLSKKILSFKAHIDICKGSPKQNIDYVKKDGDLISEWGNIPHQGSKTVGELKALDNPDELDWKMYNTWKRIHSEPQKIKVGEWKKEVKVYYIKGPSGCGKSEYSEKFIEKLGIKEFDDVKHIGDFWIGVTDGTGCCVYDDWRDSHMCASEFINFIDYRIHNLNIKGGSIKNKYNTIVISTVQSLKEIYSNCTGEPKKQWMRRIIYYKWKEDLEDFVLREMVL